MSSHAAGCIRKTAAAALAASSSVAKCSWTRALTFGRRTSRNVTSPMTASVPSEPVTSRCGLTYPSSIARCRLYPLRLRWLLGQRLAIASCCEASRSWIATASWSARSVLLRSLSISPTGTLRSVAICPSARITFIESTWASTYPYLIEWAPVELFAVIPPMLARVPLAGSGPNCQPSLATPALSRSSTTPAWQVASPWSASSRTTWLNSCVVSITMPLQRLSPARPLPAPRAVIGMPFSAANLTVACMSSMLRGSTTQVGRIW